MNETFERLDSYNQRAMCGSAAGVVLCNIAIATAAVSPTVSFSFSAAGIAATIYGFVKTYQSHRLSRKMGI